MINQSKRFNEVNIKRIGPEASHPWCRETRRLFNPLLLCGYVFDEYVDMPREVREAVVVFTPKRDSSDAFRFSPNTTDPEMGNPWIIHGTERAPLHCEMHTVLQQQWDYGNRYFHIEHYA